ncbi:hypothetical protein [Collimonas sp.]|jgi:hypothetical protein|uniref:hypothetical protein n=1 Tax=Collimonas sp. TaxID=1963772 RepID=UPI002BD836A4|nr:hypothetical protein [Collimonas sp.]HWW05892.1 hypothetical protein [Collimonas sp.]
MADDIPPGFNSVAAKLDEYFENWLRKALDDSAGHEQEGLIELVRSADLHAYFLNCFGNSELSTELMSKCRFIVHGIGPILRVFLPVLEKFADGIPWIPSSTSTAKWADQILYEAGRLSILRRLSHSERYGLVRCEFHSDEHVAIHVLGRDAESIDRDDHVWLVNKMLEEKKEYHDHLDQQIKGWARDRIDQYVGIHREHFICYDSDRELLGLYQDYVQRLMIQSAEADAFPDDVRIGSRTFAEWKWIATTAAARTCLHLSFATRLSTLNGERLDLRNLLTNFVRVEDLREIWRQQLDDITETELDDIEDIFMLTAKHAEEYFSNHDCPLPYNIRFGKYFALLPQFGYLNNTCTFLVTELKRKYREDWDRVVNLREAKFQQDLYKLLPIEQYVIGRENASIRRAAGNTETDIDAVLFERSTNCIYLFQLKWFDVFAHSLRERQSKLRNLLDKGNKWVEQICDWVSNTSQSEILSKLDLQGKGIHADSLEIRTVVLTRFSARFSGEHRYDERAAWLSWPRLCRLMSESQRHDAPLEAAWQKAKEDTNAVPQEPSSHTEYLFHGMKVDVYD